MNEISLSETTKILTVDDTFTLVASVNPENASDKSVTWTSSNASIATVSDSGLVTAVGAGVADVTVTSKSDSTKTAVCHITVNEPYIAIGSSGVEESSTHYSNLKDAINATDATNNEIFLHGNFKLNETLNINKTHKLIITGTGNSTISASETFDKENNVSLVKITGSNDVDISGVKFNANAKCRVMAINTTGNVKLFRSAILGGLIEDTSNWAPGLFITGTSKVTVQSCYFADNKNYDSTITESNPTIYYATDIWAGSETVVTIKDDCTIGKVVKNANYAGKSNSMLIVLMTNGGRIDNLFLQYDEYFGKTNSIANKGTGYAGAVLKFVSGDIKALHVADSENNVSTIDNPEVGFLYKAGEDKKAIPLA